VPQIAGCLLAGFHNLLAADVFADHPTSRAVLIAPAIHLVPAWIVVGALAVSGRWSRLGAVWFIGPAPTPPFGT